MALAWSDKMEAKGSLPRGTCRLRFNTTRTTGGSKVKAEIDNKSIMNAGCLPLRPWRALKMSLAAREINNAPWHASPGAHGSQLSGWFACYEVRSGGQEQSLSNRLEEESMEQIEAAFCVLEDKPPTYPILQVPSVGVGAGSRRPLPHPTAPPWFPSPSPNHTDTLSSSKMHQAHQRHSHGNPL